MEYTNEQKTLIEKRKNNPRWELATEEEMALTPETYEYSDEKYDLDNA